MKVLTSKNLSSLYPYLGLLLLIAPSLVWIFLDRHVWPYDQAWYGQVSVELFHRLIHSRQEWREAMVSAFGIKAPGVAWFGQLFVPIGTLIGSIDTGLLLSTLTTQFLTLVLIFKSVQELSQKKILVSVVACLAVASAPLFVAMSHQYLVESLQTMTISWFILIASFAPKWSRKTILANLLAATSIAMLAKVTSPVYFFGYSFLALAYVCYPKLGTQPQEKTIVWYKNTYYLYLFGAVVLCCGAIAWYARNLSKVADFIKLASSSSVDGKSDTFFNKAIFWLNSAQSSFFLKGVLVFLGLIVLVGIVKFFVNKNSKPIYFTICAVISLVHIAISLTAFSLSINQEARYLLPLLPHVTLISAWGLSVINQKSITILMSLAFVFQLAVVHSQALGITPPDPSISYWLHPLDRDAQNANNINDVVQKICTEPDKERYNIIGVELPWLNANSVAYFSAKQLESRKFRCYFTSLGYAETDTNKAWERLLSLRTNFFVTINLNLYPDKTDPMNQVALPIVDKVKSSKKFKLDTSLDNSKILIYKNITNSN
jgi:hypothetical protein